MKLITLRLGDCVAVMQDMPEATVGAAVCDPPYGLEFMGEDWDRLQGYTVDVNFKGFVLPRQRKRNVKCPDCEKWVYDHPPRACTCGGVARFQQRSMQDWHERWLCECFRVLRPGGVIKAFSGTRTQHRLAAAIESVGFVDIRIEAWNYGSGFPKSLNIGKFMDKQAGRLGHAVGHIKDILREAHRTSGRTLQELNEVCGFEASGYLRGSSTWASVLPSQEKWVVLRDALSLPNTFDVYFAEAEREVIAQKAWSNSAAHFVPGEDHTRRVQLNETAPATPEAQTWDGWGTALKPAWEPVIVAKKPLV